MSESAAANPYQVLAWMAATIGAGITLVQLVFNWIREGRIQRQEQARFGYQLLDDLFDDAAGEVLRKIDRGKWATDRASEDAKFFGAFEDAFRSGRSSKRVEVVNARLEFDRVLYYFDRVQHAIDAKITRLEDVQAPLAWYASLLADYSENIKAYAEGIFYARAAKLLSELNTAQSKK